MKHGLRGNCYDCLFFIKPNHEPNRSCSICLCNLNDLLLGGFSQQIHTNPCIIGARSGVNLNLKD